MTSASSFVSASCTALGALHEWALDLLFPPMCTSCGSMGAYLCDDCEKKIEIIADPLPLSPTSPLTLLIASAWYQEPLKSLLHTYKYQSVRDIGSGLGKFMAKQLHTASFTLPTLQAITAVPLHPQRLRERGFNQAGIIAASLGLYLNTPYLPLLHRIRLTSPQAQLTNKMDRLTNIAHCFSLTPETAQALPNWWSNPQVTIAIVDDVTTTGSTLEECARALKASGFRGNFIGLAVAHGK